MKYIYLVILSLFICNSVFAQQSGEMITVTGDSLVGKFVGGESIREVYGNVVITQGDVRITCLKTIQRIANNSAQLIGNVVMTQDSVIIKTDEGFYLGDEKIAYSNNGVTLNDGKMILKAKNGYYYFTPKKSYFYGGVTLFDNVMNLTSGRLTYFHNENKAIAVSNVKINDTSSTIYADSLINFRTDGITYAYNNILLEDASGNAKILGNQLYDDKEKKYTKVTLDPIFMQIDTSETGELDTLYIKSDIMEAYQDSTNKFIASGNVELLKGLFASKNNKAVYKRSEDLIYTFKEEDDTRPPILWYDNSQLTGDSIYIHLEDNQLKWIDIIQNAFILSENVGFNFKYDQISGDTVKMYFGENGLEKTAVDGGVLSIYYMFEEDRANGLVKSSAARAVMYFEDKVVKRVSMYGAPLSEYHPENLVEGKEKEFTLPVFIVYGDRPVKSGILNLMNKNKYYFLFSQKREIKNASKK